MRIFLLFFVFTFFFIHTIHAQGFDWANSAGGSGDDEALSVATDAFGNVYVVGYFASSSITFGAYPLNNTGSYTDIFLVKYNASGSVIWAKNVGNNAYDEACSVATDASGNVYVAGYFGNTSITFGSTTLTNSGFYTDIFLVKYDTYGNVIWARSAGGTGYDEATSVSIDAIGNVYISGDFASPTANFGSITLTNTSTSGYYDVFLAKYDASGNIIWAKSAGGSDQDFARSVCTDASGNIYMTGNYNSSSITFGSTTLLNAGYGDVFLVKYSTSGNVIWANGAGGMSDDKALSVATDVSGNVYIAGYFQAPSITFGSYTLTNAGGNDMFLVKYNPSGTVIWANGVGSTSDEIATSVTTDALGNIFVAGQFLGTSINFGAIPVTSIYFYNLFLARYDSYGNAIWVSTAGTTGSGGNNTNSAATDNAGNIYSTGSFANFSLNFGTIVLSTSGGNDMYIAKCNGSTGIQSVNNLQSFLYVYPNPNDGKMTVSFLGNNIDGFQIYDCLGREIDNIEKKYFETTQLELPNLKDGFYYLQTKRNNGYEKYGFIIKH